MKNGPTIRLTKEEMYVLKKCIKNYPTKIAFCKANDMSPVTLFDVLLKGTCSLKTAKKIAKVK